ncbi:hypothetical protein EGR_05128 [Echinococcus granulosus]|uniref:Uncharacterized protein n=1 Tax=Echinococcus granulosus TaxID=6210 RepID=W6UNU6_ECHGR|nr:hypothetical protein EGR_05128 [Echinococcus granulosus]EUB59967.1 hypothetical protein EGR_05128 [Echinococcus granulosus]
MLFMPLKQNLPHSCTWSRTSIVHYTKKLHSYKKAACPFPEQICNHFVFIPSQPQRFMHAFKQPLSKVQLLSTTGFHAKQQVLK